MLDSAYIRIGIMGSWGFYAKTIRRLVKKYDGTTYSTSTIYATLKKQGIKIRDYREGKGWEAKRTLESVDADLGAYARDVPFPKKLRQKPRKQSKKRARAA